LSFAVTERQLPTFLYDVWKYKTAGQHVVGLSALTEVTRSH